MTFERGYLTLGKWRSAPIRVHWSAPVGALVFSQFRFVPGFWLAFVGLILAHEMGHALMVATAEGAWVRSIDVTGLGGECRYEGNVTPLRRALIAWGGVFAQLAVLIITGMLLLLFGSPDSLFLAEVAEACTFYNLTLIGLNLLPVRPLDGHEAWKLFPLLRHRWKHRERRTNLESSTAPLQPSLLPRLHDATLEVQRLRELLERR